MPQQKKLFLLDAMALIYRAYFALSKNPRMTSYGLNTSAIMGFANSLYDVLKNEKPTHIAVAFDSRKPTVRHEVFKEYKANREEMPEDIATALPYIERLIKAFNIPVFAVEGYEADDIIGTVAKQAEKQGFTTYMMTPDKDFAQLVSNNTFVYKPARMGNKAEVLGVKEVCERFNINQPIQVTDILGLWGDASDNIPGVPGIGEKTAKKLIGEFNTIDNLLQNTDKLKGKMKENVEAYADQALLSKQLATIILDVPVDFDEGKLSVTDPDIPKLKKLFNELEFRVFAKRLFTDLSLKQSDTGSPEELQKNLFTGAPEPGDLSEEEVEKASIQTTDHTYHLINTKEKREALIRALAKQPSFCFDTETTGLDANNSELVGVSFSFKPHEAYYVQLPENYNETLQIITEFKPVFENPDIEKIGQNLKFDISILKWYDVEVKGKLFDTMLAHYLLQPDMRHNMDVLAESYLNYKPIPIESLIGKRGKNQLSIRLIDTDIIKEYAAEDADVTFQLKQVFKPLLEETKTVNLFNDIEVPLVPVLSSMEAEGIKLDTGILNDFSIQLEKEIQNLIINIHDQAGISFNISSPKQLGEVLFERLKITDKPKLTRTKQYGTSEDVLLKLMNKHPIIRNILDYRSLFKLKSTYVDALPSLVNPRTGRIHTSYNQAVAATGRLSSNNPNLQNIPIRTARGREIRKAFVPRNHNYILLAADYSQIELRIIAEMSGDEAMQEAFVNKLDIHTATAAKVYGVDINIVSKEMRRNAKTVNFGIIYGISAFGLSERLNISRKEAAEIINQYLYKYPGIQDYMDKTIAFAREHGFVETMMGRRRYIREINSGNATVRGFSERNAINAPIQGSAADMIKIAMIKVFNEFEKRKLKSKMILQVHDELVFDAHRDELGIIKPIIENEMKNAITMKVPIEVDINTGENWLDAH
ncbi:MAG: DNA polymerase I [Bacteroidales bacterium]|nr:DNA polymerase I [Bacteroidales bacterium]